MDTYIPLKDDLEAQERGKAYFVAQAAEFREACREAGVSVAQARKGLARARGRS